MLVRIEIIEGVVFVGDKSFAQAQPLFDHLLALAPTAIAPPIGPRLEDESVEAFLARGGEIKILPACGTTKSREKIDPTKLNLEAEMSLFLGLE